MRPAVFLDRDDTLIANRDITALSPYPGDLFDPELVHLLPGAGEACALLARSGYALVVVSNQGAVARGRCTIADVEACNQRLRQLLHDGHRADLAAVYYCPYHPAGIVPPYNVEHPSRKPGPGMILSAARDLDLDLARSWLIGDMPRDTEAGLNAGIPRDRLLLLAPAGPVASISEAAALIVARGA